MFLLLGFRLTVKNQLMKKLIIYFCILFFSTLQAQQAKVDSLLVVLKNLKEDTAKVNGENDICKLYIAQANYEVAMQHAQKALVLSEKLDYEKGVAKAHGNIGLIYWYTNSFASALESFEKLLVISKKIGDKKGIATAFNNKGLIFMYQGNYKDAIGNFYKSLKIKEEIGDKAGVGISYLNIGNIYLNQGNNEMALSFFSKSLEINRALKDKKYEATNLNNMGIAYVEMGNPHKALEYYINARDIYREIGDKKGLAMAYSNVGLIYSELSELENALDNLMESLEIYMEIGDEQGMGVSYSNIANVYLKQKKIDEAFRFINKAINLLKPIGYKVGIKDAYSVLINIYKEKKDYKQALTYHKMYTDIKDSLLNESSNEQITEMNTKYESEKKEKDIQLLTKDKALQQSEIGRQKLIRNSFIIGLLLALVLAYVLFNRFQLTRKQKHIIEAQNDQIVESINYSKRIQDSLLPSIESMQKALPGLFVFNLPKNIVSGDFYFFKEFKNYILLACVDCTGHGVPGGFMSTLGSLLLDKIADNEALKPSEILTRLNDEIVRILHQQAGGEIQDGMDLSVCLIDRNNHSIEFSGARNGIIVVSGDSATRYKASPLPVGGNYMKKGKPVERNFQTQNISLNPTDWVYMYTDGFIEQVGGPENMPMNYGQFETQLINLSKKQTAVEKTNMLETSLVSWSGNNERTDDVLILGFQVS